MAQQVQYFNGIRFALVKGGKYFSNTTLHKSMHRYVWEYYNGEIPKGFDIHHKDGNRYNNDISNLECIEHVEHEQLHGKNLSEEERAWRRNNLNNTARPKAIVWHKSDAGIAWHREQVKHRKDNRSEVICECLQCKKQFITYNNAKKPKKFCTGACAQKYRRDNGLGKVDAICEVCGKHFMTDKYRPNRTCGKSCGVALAWREGKTGKIGNRRGN